MANQAPITLADELQNFTKSWKLDGDLMRCEICGRGIHCTNHNEAMHHSSDCTNPMQPHPWRYLHAILRAMFSPDHQIINELLSRLDGYRSYGFMMWLLGNYADKKELLSVSVVDIIKEYDVYQLQLMEKLKCKPKEQEESTDH